MNWTDLQCLEAFRTAGSLQAAAEQLQMHHTTVARRLRQLEETLGCTLVETVNGRLRFTTEGRRAAEAAECISIETLALRRDLEGRDAEVSGPIRVGLLDFFLDVYADTLADFSRRHPEVRLELRSSGSQLHSLIRREADVVMRVTRSPRETLVGRKVETLRYAVFAERQLAASAPYEQMPWVGWTRTMGARLTDAWMQEHLGEGQIRVRVDSTAAMHRMARAGAGAAILPTRYADADPLLTRMSDVIDGFDTDVWLVTHRDLAQLERIRRFMAALAESIASPVGGGRTAVSGPRKAPPRGAPRG